MESSSSSLMKPTACCSVGTLWQKETSTTWKRHVWLTFTCLRPHVTWKSSLSWSATRRRAAQSTSARPQQQNCLWPSTRWVTGSHPFTRCCGRTILSNQLWFLPLQPAERRVPDWKGHNLSGGLPGDQHHSTILDQGPRQASTAVKKRSLTVSFDEHKKGF